MRGLAELCNSGIDFAGKTITLLSDIDLSAYSAGVGWEPIGRGDLDQQYRFCGNFDGNGKTISHLTINNKDEDEFYMGLFGSAVGGTICNVRLTEVDIVSFPISTQVGALVGNAYDICMENCSVTGRINGGSYTGGLAGNLEESRIRSCYVDCVVSGLGAGGIVGNVSFGSIVENCYSTGIISGEGLGSAGGIASEIYISASIINCYSDAAVGGGEIVGGVVGQLGQHGAIGGDMQLLTLHNAEVKNCYFAGTVRGQKAIGGIAGEVIYGNVTRCVALNTNIQGDEKVGRVIGEEIYNTEESAVVLTENYALADMQIKEDYMYKELVKGPDQIDGADIILEEAARVDFWTDTLGWDSTVWQIEDGCLPVLKSLDFTPSEPEPTKAPFHESGNLGGGVTVLIITFETSGGSAVQRQRVNANQKVKEPEMPTKEGVVFAGWYLDKEYKEAYDFEKRVTKNLTLYAKWEEESAQEETTIELIIGSRELLRNGERISMDVVPVIKNDRTYMPIRFVAESLGAEVAWSDERQQVEITSEDSRILLTIGEKTAYVNGKAEELEAAPFLEDDRSFTPVRFIAENLGAVVDWTEGEQKIIIKKLQ